MPDRKSVNYFGAGPALLPSDSLHEAAADLLNYDDIGIGIGEISHRSKPAAAVVEKAKEDLVKLMDIPDTHDVLFMQGGGTGLFSAVTYLFQHRFIAKHGKTGKADYLISGNWSNKASQEASRLGVDVNVVFDARRLPGADGKFGQLPQSPSDYHWGNPQETAYAYYCDNETVHGVEFPTVPQVPQGVPLVADMSSNILSRTVDVSKFSLIFAGAQKNVGLAGIVIVIVSKEVMAEAAKSTSGSQFPLPPIVFDFPTVAREKSLYNTLPIFCVHVAGLVIDKLYKTPGGLKTQQKIADSKAEKIYKVLDSAPKGFFKLPVSKNARSRMNIVFTIPTPPGEPDREAQFLKEAESNEILGIKGHRSVGGIRISNYNAITEESIHVLLDFINKFIKEHSN